MRKFHFLDDSRLQQPAAHGWEFAIARAMARDPIEGNV